MEADESLHKPTSAYAGSEGEHYDELHRKLRQLHAALFQCSGGGFDNFAELAPAMQDNYLCMMSDLVESALEHAKHLGATPKAEVANG
jgi:hypothetical protein